MTNADDPVENLLQIAVAIGARRLPVFSCGQNKRPAVAEASGGHGHLDAVTEPNAVRELFARAPHARLVGVPTGECSGFDVLDTDPRHGGHLWEAEHAYRLPRTRMHRTQGGGYHRLFRHAEGVRNRAGCPVPGVDIRGAGGYIIMPPSQGYSVIDDAPIEEWPPWLLEVVRRPLEQPRRPAIAADPGQIPDARLDDLLRSLLARVSAAPEGLKHHTLRGIARVVGGYAHLLPHTDEQLVGLLLDALPDTVEDWKTRATHRRVGSAEGPKRAADAGRANSATATELFAWLCAGRVAQCRAAGDD